MKVLGISAFYHDSAATICLNGEILAAAQEERFTRVKHDAAFPVQAISWCLKESGFELDQLDAVVFYDKPLIKFERLLETYMGFAPKGVRSFFSSMPVWIREKLFLKKLIRDGLGEVGRYDRKKLKLLFPEHHLSHAASAFYPSPFEEAAVLTIDGVGEWATASMSHGKGSSLRVLRELHFPHSVGLLYSAFTYYCGFKVNSGEYKLMGLAPYGQHGSEEVGRFETLIRKHLVHIYEDGSIHMDQHFYGYATGLRMADDEKWEELFGVKRRDPESDLTQVYCNLALAIQLVTEDIVIRMAAEAKRLTGSENLCLAGGVALNCVANGKLQHTGLFKNIYIQPAAGDAGGALGAALAAEYLVALSPRIAGKDQMKGALLGPSFGGEEVERMKRGTGAKARHFSDFSKLCQEVAALLEGGKVIGWMQGSMEFGPRALGNRSILADARNPEMQKQVNLKVKFREGFRPFAPSVLESQAATYFELDGTSPYMLLVQPVRSQWRNTLPADYESWALTDKLYFIRSTLPAITHIDFSARIQTVNETTNPQYSQLLEAFRQRTGMGLLLNTSFNVRGEPLVCSPSDAYRCFMRTAIDYLVIGEYLFAKEDQPEWVESGDWKSTYGTD